MQFDDDKMKYYKYELPFTLENGIVLNNLTLAYHTLGKMNNDKSNVVWICHHLTANSEPSSWWKGVVGSGCAIDPDKHFIISANVPGSCYGSSGPLSPDPSADGQPY